MLKTLSQVAYFKTSLKYMDKDSLPAPLKTKNPLFVVILFGEFSIEHRKRIKRFEVKFKSSETSLWIFDGNSVEKIIEIVKFEVEKLFEFPKTIKGFKTKKLERKLNKDFSQEDIDRDILLKTAKESYETGYSVGYGEKEKEIETSEFKQIMRSDVISGGFLAGSIISFIEGLTQNDLVKLSFGLFFISLAIGY